MKTVSVSGWCFPSHRMHPTNTEDDKNFLGTLGRQIAEATRVISGSIKDAR